LCKATSLGLRCTFFTRDWPSQFLARNLHPNPKGEFNKTLQQVIDAQTDPWGDQSFGCRDQARRFAGDDEARDGASGGKRTRPPGQGHHAEGEFQAATRLRDAARIIHGYPNAMQMRFLLSAWSFLEI
jgi:hypothetical protein